jgi:hypothetical protein
MSPGQEQSPAVLRVRIRNKQRVELEALSAAFMALADEYENFLEVNMETAVAEDVRLYVSRIRGGSILTDLMALAPLALPFIENTNSIVTFAGHLKTAFDGLLGKAKTPTHLPKRTLENITTFVEPIARDNASQLNVQTVIEGGVHYNITVNSLQANAIQNAVRRELAGSKEIASGRHEKVLMYLHQARNDPKSTVGDRAIIETLTDVPVKIVFASEQLKAEVIHGSENPFRKAFVVDVEVGTVNGRPALYKIVAVHDTVDRPDAAYPADME